jgi:hypothetical protein
MGDLPGSPSVAPSPLFCTAPCGEGGREPRWASHAAPVLPDRSSTPPEGRNVGAPRWCLHRSTHAVGGRGTCAFFSVFFLFSFLVSPPLCFPFCFWARGVARGPELRNAAPAREVADSSRSVQRRRGEDSRRGVSVRALLAASLPHGPVVSIAEGEGA